MRNPFVNHTLRGQSQVSTPSGHLRVAARVLLAACLLLLAACEGAQSALDPQGPVAAEIARLWWVLLAVCAGAFVLIMALLFYAVFTAPERRRRLNHAWFVIGGGLVFPTVSVIALLIYGTEIGRRIIAEPDGPVLQVEITGHQWWWEVYYPPDGEQPGFVTANELHLPVGMPVEFTLRGHDVIHSFWVPNLGGKLDMIPGHENVIRLEAQRSGEFRGHCSEFCGAQHARMAFTVMALEAEEFAAWRASRAVEAPRTDDLEPELQRGRQQFIVHGCADCHAVRGSIPGSGAGDPLTGVRGPDLTRVAARSTIGARTLPYSRDNVIRWIRENDRFKPGNRMPDFPDLPEDSIEAIAEFLDSLR